MSSRIRDALHNSVRFSRNSDSGRASIVSWSPPPRNINAGAGILRQAAQTITGMFETSMPKERLHAESYFAESYFVLQFLHSRFADVSQLL
jgi:hypothetical protein